MMPLDHRTRASLTMRDRLFVHVVWATRDRSWLIDGNVARFLERFLAAVAQQERARIVQVGIVRTHLHLLLRLHPTTQIPRLLQRLKGGSAVIANREGHATVRELKWAKGYDIESVSARSVERVRAYIRDQPQRHPGEAIPDWKPDGGDVAMSDSQSTSLARVKNRG